MAGELLKKINELKKLVLEKSNKEFKKNAVEYLNPSALDEHHFQEIDPHHAEVCPVPCEEAPMEEPSEMDLLKMRSMIASAIADEEEAIALYLKKASKCIDHGCMELAALFKELAGDEMVHSASLRATLEIFELDDISKEIEGRREAFHILAKSVFEDFETASEKKKREALKREAEKVRKEFDFAEEYAKNKALYNKEKVTSVINDLIAGKQDLDGAMNILVNDCKKVARDSKNQKKEKKIDKKSENE